MTDYFSNKVITEAYVKMYEAVNYNEGCFDDLRNAANEFVKSIGGEQEFVKKPYCNCSKEMMQFWNKYCKDNNVRGVRLTTYRRVFYAELKNIYAKAQNAKAQNIVTEEMGLSSDLYDFTGFVQSYIKSIGGEQEFIKKPYERWLWFTPFLKWCRKRGLTVMRSNMSKRTVDELLKKAYSDAKVRSQGGAAVNEGDFDYGFDGDFCEDGECEDCGY